MTKNATIKMSIVTIGLSIVNMKFTALTCENTAKKHAKYAKKQ